MPAETANSADTDNRKQFNVSIDTELHRELRMAAIARGRSIRDFSEDVLRLGMSQLIGADGQKIGRSGTNVPVDSEA